MQAAARRGVASAASASASFHSTAAALSRSTPRIRFNVREKRTDTKNALKNILLNGGPCQERSSKQTRKQKAGGKSKVRSGSGSNPYGKGRCGIDWRNFDDDDCSDSPYGSFGGNRASPSLRRREERAMRGEGDEASAPLLQVKEAGRGARVAREWWDESKRLWRIVGPAIFQRVALYGINVVSQAFIGHIGDLELAAFSIASTVIAGFNFGFLLGMASALETLCGQAFGAKKHHMLGIYLQRSWVVLFIFAAALTPTYVFTEDLLLLLGQTPELSRLAGKMSVWLIPQHFAMAMLLPLTRFLQSQLKNWVTAATAGVTLALHVLVTYLLVSRFQLGYAGVVVAADVAWWIVVLGQLFYVVCGGCPLSWKGFSMEAFADFWDFIKLSTASGVMLCMENWYYRVLVLLTGYLPNAEIAVDALSICFTINGWEMMIPLGFLAATGVRVANELGAGSGKGARFSIIVSITTSMVIGLVFWCLILTYNDQIALLFSSGKAVLDAVHNLSILLAFTILLNSVQPVLSGVAIGSGWQALVAYVNIGSYYLVGVPIGIILGWPLGFGVSGIWSGLIGGTAVQTLVLVYLTMRCDWDDEAKTTSARMRKWASTK